MLRRRNLSRIIDGVYIGNLNSARHLEDPPTDELGITHILSVCPEYPSTGPNHLVIPVSDYSNEDILIHLPTACKFIDDALARNGKILVHCVMGISRSVTVVSAYLMKMRQIPLNEALLVIKRQRPQLHPNPGFLKQLQLFEECQYAPTPSNPIYIKFKQQQAALKECESDLFTATSPFELEPPVGICDNIYVCEELPSASESSGLFEWDIPITHLLLISPVQTLEDAPLFTENVECKELPITDIRLESLLVHLNEACAFIRRALASGGTVMIHCLLETRTSQVLCAYMMEEHNMSAQKAFAVYEIARPLFHPSPSFFTQLEIYEACSYNATPGHPRVMEWVARNSPSNSRRGSSFGNNANGASAGAWKQSMGSIRARWSD